MRLDLMNRGQAEACAQMLGAIMTRTHVRPLRLPDQTRAVDSILDKLGFENKTVREAAAELKITVGSAKTYLDKERKRNGSKTLYNLVAFHVRNKAGTV